jgi:hypothetical protein
MSIRSATMWLSPASGLAKLPVVFWHAPTTPVVPLPW